jgi:hypothetical protein
MRPLTRSPLVALFAVTVLFRSSVRADTPTDAEEAIIEMYKSDKLFDKKQYTAVRAAFTQRFEQKHQAVIRKAYGDDYETLNTWLDAHADIKQKFYTALNEKYDKLPAALTLFKELWKKSPEQVEKYPNVAIAVAVVWDDPVRAIYDYRDHQVRTKSTMPDELVDAVGNFQYLVDSDKGLESRFRPLPWEFLTFVVDHRTPLKEREWARKYHLTTRGRLRSWHQAVPYDMDMLKGEQSPSSGLKPKLQGKLYSLENIRTYGGVCAQQADFAARVAKSVGMPAVYCWGESSYRGLHAWWMYVTVQSVVKDQVKFLLFSDGRVEGFQKDQFYTGNVIDPQTGQQMLDRDLERRLWVVGQDASGKRQADLLMRAYPWLVSKLEMDVKARVVYLDKCLKVSPYNEDAWLEFARLCKAGELATGPKAIVLTHLAGLSKTFANYPDFVWRLIGDLVTIQTDPKDQVKHYEQVVTQFEKAGRPDLACAARLKITELWCAQEKWQTAGQGLIATIRKFPNEGRYVPQMTRKLQEVAPRYKTGSAALAQLYLELVPAMIVYYRHENEYCTKLYDQAVKFLLENKLDKQATLLKLKTDQARLLASQK